MKNNFFISFLFLLCAEVNSQSSGGVEQYYYTRTADASAVMTPIAHFTSSNKWYGEARYNYDDLQTFSLYAGKTFSQKGNVSWEATPMVGGLMGQMTGGSVGMNFGMDFKKLFFSSQSQYSFSFESRMNKYFFNWSELGYEATPWLYAGVALQQTNVYRTEGKMEPGCMIGFSIRNWTIPLYAFSPASEGRYFIVGLSWQWQHSNRKNNYEQVLTAESNTKQQD